MVFSRASLTPTGFVLEIKGILWDSGNIFVSLKAKAGMCNFVNG